MQKAGKLLSCEHFVEATAILRSNSEAGSASNLVEFELSKKYT